MIKNVKLYALIWTTTPWTLPSNQAVCFNKNLEYSIIKLKNSDENYLVSTNLESSLKEIIGEFEVIGNISGDKLNLIKYRSPFGNEELPFLNSNHVKSDKGTGLVHTAPAHGPDDFLVSLEHGLSVVSDLLYFLINFKINYNFFFILRNVSLMKMETTQKMHQIFYKIKMFSKMVII